MNKRNKYEENVFQFLLKCGVPKEEISEPDKGKGSTRKEPDFIVASVKLAIEVKHFQNSDMDNHDIKMTEQFRSGEIVSYFLPVKNDTFEKHLSSASKKFDNYPGYSTLVVEDLSERRFLNPSKEFLVAGIQTIHFSTSDKEVTKVTNQARHLRVDKNKQVGAICFLEKDSISIYQNICADHERLLPYYFWAKKLGNVEFNQYIYLAPPGEQSHLYKVEPCK